MLIMTIKSSEDIYNILLCIFFINVIIKTQEINETVFETLETSSELIVVSCKHKNDLIGADNSTYEVIEVVVDEKIILECHYCNENDPHEPKIWYKFNQNLTQHEVELDMHNDDNLNRIAVSVEHSLIIKNSTIEDMGTYFCRGLQNVENTLYFNYVVDFVNNTDKKPEIGDLNQWRVYFDDYIYPINKKFLNSLEEEFVFIKDKLQVHFDIIFDWEPEFTPCEICGRPQGQGIQRKYGYCRILIKDLNITKRDTTKLKLKDSFNYLMHLSKISCRSVLFENIFPYVGALTKTLRDFTIEKKCNGTCNPAGVNKEFKFGTTKNYKYRKIITMVEGEHLILVCPETDFNDNVTWRRNGKKLPKGSPIINTDEELNKVHIIVDEFSSLYLKHVRPEEAGNYTCQVNDIRMQQTRIFVYSKSKLITAEFARHMKYLFFILCLSGTCYCSGVIAACFRKDKFKGYEEVSQVTTTYV